MSDLVYFYPQGHEAHAWSAHPERPERVEAIRQALQAAGWWQPSACLDALDVPADVLQAVHDPDYLSLLKMACQRGGLLDHDTYVMPASWPLALRAAGGALAIAYAVWQGAAQYGFALCRPPGHHAMRAQGMGFCLLNNIALAAEYLLRHGGAQRLAIVDLDLHHGNGTQDIFWRRKDVFYISTHQSPLYPGSGALEEMGEGEGAGYTLNFPLPPGSGDEAFRVVMDDCILPRLRQYRPQMILVSYGFDPHWRDPLGHLRLSAAAYGGLIARLRCLADEVCGGRMAIVLEGGYDLDAAAACSQAVVAALLGQTFADPLGPSPAPERSEWRVVLAKAQHLWQMRL